MRITAFIKDGRLDIPAVSKNLLDEVLNYEAKPFRPLESIGTHNAAKDTRTTLITSTPTYLAAKLRPGTNQSDR
jgi:hypothetical protein